MTHYYDHGHKTVAGAEPLPWRPIIEPEMPPVSGGRAGPLATDLFVRLVDNGWGTGEVLLTEEEYASMRQAVVTVARLRLMHRPYRGVADVGGHLRIVFGAHRRPGAVPVSYGANPCPGLATAPSGW